MSRFSELMEELSSDGAGFTELFGERPLSGKHFCTEGMKQQ